MSTHHGFRKHELYSVLNHMNNRCYNPKDKKYKDYGARGITICDRWNRNVVGTKQALINFISDMYPAYQKGLSIDRINNDGNYEPSNCKWSTPKEQVHNRRNSKKCDASINTACKKYGGVKKYTPQNRKYSTVSGKPLIGVNIKDGSIVEFAKIDYAELVLGISHANINKCCNGKRKSAGGYYWKYKESVE